MSVNIARQERAYRRGLVLGFTVAEIFILLVFALLLALAAYLLRREAEVAELEEIIAHPAEARRIVQTLRRAAETNAALQETLDRAVSGEEDAFDDLFRELVLAAPTEQLQNEVLALRERVKKLEVETDSTAQKAAALDSIAAEAGLISQPPQEVARQVTAILEAAVQAFGGSEELRATAELRQTVEDLRGQVEYLQRRYGTDHPPCWFELDPETGARHIEYIFNIEMAPEGLVIHDNQLPHRAIQQARLPGMSEITFDQPLGQVAFLEQTLPIYRWSRQEEPECRFFVRAIDQTGDDKALYVSRLNAVESHFYKLILRP